MKQGFRLLLTNVKGITRLVYIVKRWRESLMKKCCQYIHEIINRQESQYSRWEYETAGPQGETDAGPDQLSGKTIVRFIHVSYETIGGLQQYITDLDEELLKRNKDLTLIYLYPTTNPDDTTVRKTAIGKGTLVSVPLNIAPDTNVTQEHTRSYIFRILRFIITSLHLKEVIFNLVFDELFVRLFITWPVFQELYQRSLNRMRKIPEAQLTNAVHSITAEHNKTDVAVMHSVDIAVDNETFMNVMHANNIPVVLMNHGTNRNLGGVSSKTMHPGELHSVVMKKLVTGCDAVAGVTNVGAPLNVKEKYSSLYDSVNIDFFHPSKADAQAVAEIRRKAGSVFIILLVARICRSKGQIDALELARHIKKAGIKANILCVGPVYDISYKQEVDAMIEKYELSQYLDFTGGMTQETIRNYYAASDVVILPSQSEGLPRTILEAMSMEKPVVAYGVDGIWEEIVDGKTGYIIPVTRNNNFKAARQLLALKVIELLKDRNLQQCMGQCGRTIVAERFTTQALVSRHERFYASVMRTR